MVANSPVDNGTSRRAARYPRDAEATGGGRHTAVETKLAGQVKHLLAGGRREEAAERFGEIVDRQQRRAARIAYYYLRDPAEVDEVVQDAFLKAFTHLPSFREDLFFELWFTRILVNACLDRLKARGRRGALDGASGDPRGAAPGRTAEPRNRHRKQCCWPRNSGHGLEVAIDRLPVRQRTAMILSHLEGRPAREVSAIMGLNESTVRVHLFPSGTEAAGRARPRELDWPQGCRARPAGKRRPVKRGCPRQARKKSSRVALSREE